MSPEKSYYPWLPVAWVVGPLILGAVTVGLFLYRPKPDVIVHTVTQEKLVPVPCPTTRTGQATTKGQQSPAISGSNNGVTYGTPPPKPHP
jgi:hypothetical protein